MQCLYFLEFLTIGTHYVLDKCGNCAHPSARASLFEIVEYGYQQLFASNSFLVSCVVLCCLSRYSNMMHSTRRFQILYDAHAHAHAHAHAL